MTDADIDHAARHGIRRIRMEDDLTIIERAAARFEELADELDSDTVEVERTGDLRTIADVAEAVVADQARLREAVALARAHGRSWNEIAVALGVSRQAARQRFGNTATA